MKTLDSQSDREGSNSRLDRLNCTGVNSSVHVAAGQ
jgi:hypothetical protein